MPLEIGIIRNIKTADEAVGILGQAHAEGKRAVVVQTESGRAIRITKPNNILTQLINHLSGQTNRELIRFNEFVSSLRENEVRLTDRSAQIVTSSAVENSIPTDRMTPHRLDTIREESPEDFEALGDAERAALEEAAKSKPASVSLETSSQSDKVNVEQRTVVDRATLHRLDPIIEESPEALAEEEQAALAEAAAQSKPALLLTEENSQENIEELMDKTKQARSAEVRHLLDANNRKLSDKVKTEQRAAAVHKTNDTYSEEVKRLLKGNMDRKAADDKEYDGHAELLQMDDKANRKLDAMIDASRKEFQELVTDTMRQENAQYVADMQRALKIVSPSTAWKMIPNILESGEPSLALHYEASVKEAVIRERLSAATEVTKPPAYDVDSTVKQIASRVTQTKGSAAIFNAKNPEAFDPYAIISFETLEQRVQEAVDLVMQGKSLDELPVHRNNDV